jgi:prepilin-type N-terminal cleavage/methylation domain-containing protein
MVTQPTVRRRRTAMAATRAAPASAAPAPGFTAIELLVVIVIVAVLASIAMPSFADFSVNQRLRTASYDLIADLTFARGEAVKRSNRVTIGPVGSSWAAGWSVTDVTSGTTLRVHPPLDTSVVETTRADPVTFGLDGHQPVGRTAVTITFDDVSSKTTIPARTVILDPSGRPKSS